MVIYRPKVGVGVIVIKNNKILLGKRLNSHGEGSWSFPGGHLEYKETWEECAIRETMEETGICVNKVRFGSVTNDIFCKEDKHYVTIFMLADYLSGDARVREPEKCEKWDWFEWEKLPDPLFIPIENLIKNNFNPINRLS
ncbi:NUDIX hydrolase [Gaetbulibacter sp. M235]|uniref:nucleotide triphosphate diphosphatase NUDT15 n=1 Tax=Gaetbulibacter sp. M235 TaxID=3126510 RepID=UPI00374FB68D